MVEWNASAYNRHSNLQAVLAEEQLARFSLAGAERVLDIGCGDGKITAEIAARVPRGSVLGVDPSQDMIAFATRHFGPATRPNVRFEIADVRRLTYRAEFDRVVSFNMGLEDRAWDFQTHEAFVAFAQATFVEWTRHLPESDWPAFITEVLDQYRTVAASGPQEANTFKFYQLEVVLEPA
jgi:SAM-dependent methyltransferase